MMMKRLAIALLGCTVLMSCAPTTAQVESKPPMPTPVSDADMAKINGTSKKFEKAINAGDFDAVAATYAEDAVILPPGIPPIQGREKIKEYFKGFPPAKDFVLKDDEVVAFGDYAYARGRYSMILTIDGKEVKAAGSYLDIRKKQSDGSWLYINDMFSEDAPAKEPAPTKS